MLQSLTARNGGNATGDVTLSGHTTVTVPGLTTYQLPTTVRTGTGTINVAAGLDVNLGADTTAPGVATRAFRERDAVNDWSFAPRLWIGRRRRCLTRAACIYSLRGPLGGGLAKGTLVAGTGPRRRVLIGWSLWVGHWTDCALPT